MTEFEVTGVYNALPRTFIIVFEENECPIHITMSKAPLHLKDNIDEIYRCYPYEIPKKFSKTNMQMRLSQLGIEYIRMLPEIKEIIRTWRYLDNPITGDSDDFAKSKYETIIVN